MGWFGTHWTSYGVLIVDADTERVTQEWYRLSVPVSISMCSTVVFRDMLGMGYNGMGDRNTVVIQLRSANITRSGKRMVAAQDRPPLAWAARSPCFGAKHA